MSPYCDYFTAKYGKLFQYAKRRDIDISNYNDVVGDIIFDNIL